MVANAKNKPRIVIVENDPAMNQAIERLLRAAGFRTSGFASSEALIQTGAPKNSDCFVLDIDLPGASGLNLWTQLLRSGVRAPVVFVTAFDDPDSALKAARFGAAGFLTKPFSGRRLLSTISSALHTASLEKNSKTQPMTSTPRLLKAAAEN